MRKIIEFVKIAALTSIIIVMLATYVLAPIFGSFSYFFSTFFIVFFVLLLSDF